MQEIFSETCKAFFYGTPAGAPLIPLISQLSEKAPAPSNLRTLSTILTRDPNYSSKQSKILSDKQ